jgi:uncharacterized protein YbjQ (UPF0145 family)
MESAPGSCALTGRHRGPPAVRAKPPPPDARIPGQVDTAKEEHTMKCERCQKEYPSVYYFATRSVCRDCFAKLTPEEQTEAKRPPKKYQMTTTAFTIDGHRIVKSLGVVRGITVRSRSVIGTIGAALQTIVGGEITLFSELCEQTRLHAFDMMVDHALEIGANAVVGVRYDATEVMDGVTEVLCYGTAVVVEAAAA